MSCKRCDGVGYIESPTMINNQIGSVLQKCCDLTKYSNEVQRRLNARKRDNESDEQKASRELGHGNGMILEFRVQQK
jgi:hypothetical protein